MTFSCTYAGQPVCLDHEGRLAELLETRWPDPGWLFSRQRMGGAASPFMAGGGINDRIKPPYPDLPPIGLNELIVPTGASRFARGLFVVDNVRLKQIVYECYGYTDASPTALASLPANWDAAWTPKTLSIVQGGVTFSWPMYLLPPVILDASGSNTLWLLPMVDQRYFWQSKGFESGSSIGSTWGSLVDSLVSAAGTSLAGTLSAHADYGTFDPETFADKSITLGTAIDVAALSLGRRVVFDGSSLTFQTAATADTAREANLALLGLRLGGSSPGTIPAESPRISCRVVHDHWPDASGVYELTPTVNNTGTSPERPSIRSAWYVEHFGGTVSAASQTDAQAFADQVATDLLAWGNRQTIASFAGIAPWSLSGHDDYLSIRIHDDIGGAAAILRVASLPHSFRPAVNLCQRPGIYVHPHSTATGTLYEALAPGGSAEVSLNAVESLYSGQPARIVARASLANPGVELDAGTPVFLHYQAGVGWGIVATSDSGEESALVLFMLDGPLSSGTALATVQAVFPTDAANPPVVAPTITVSDPGLLFKYGVPYSRGWAWKSGDTYRVIQCDQLALQLRGTLTTRDGSGSGQGSTLKPTTTARVEPTLEALTPAPFSQLPTGLHEQDIPNPLQLSGEAGDSVVLQFDATTGSYFVLAVQKWATRIVGTATAAFDEGDLQVTVDNLVGVDGPVREASILALNSHSLWADANRYVRCEFLPTQGSWEIYQTSKKYVDQRVVAEVYKTDTAIRERSTTLKTDGRVQPEETWDVIELTSDCPEGSV